MLENFWPWVTILDINEFLFFWLSVLIVIVANVTILITLARRKYGRDSKISKKSLQTVQCFVSISVVFLITASPVIIFLQLYYVNVEAVVKMDPVTSILTFYDLNAILFTNNGINFLSYLLTSSDYRMTLKKLLTKKSI